MNTNNTNNTDNANIDKNKTAKLAQNKVFVDIVNKLYERAIEKGLFDDILDEMIAPTKRMLKQIHNKHKSNTTLPIPLSTSLSNQSQFKSKDIKTVDELNLMLKTLQSEVDILQEEKGKLIDKDKDNNNNNKDINKN